MVTKTIARILIWKIPIITFFDLWPTASLNPGYAPGILLNVEKCRRRHSKKINVTFFGRFENYFSEWRKLVNKKIWNFDLSNLFLGAIFHSISVLANTNVIALKASRLLLIENLHWVWWAKTVEFPQSSSIVSQILYYILALHSWWKKHLPSLYFPNRKHAKCLARRSEVLHSFLQERLEIRIKLRFKW